jgi:hypothetical protein
VGEKVGALASLGRGPGGASDIHATIATDGLPPGSVRRNASRMIRLLSLLLLCSPIARALTIEMRPDGPVATLAAARDAIRKARADGAREPIVVRIAGGTYPLTEPVVFDPQDGDASYEAAPGAPPVFVGGKRIAPFVQGADGVWTARIDPAWKFDALWINGRRATRARTPNTGYVNASGAPSAPLAGVKLNGSLAASAINVPPEAAVPLAALSPDEMRDANVIVYHSWQTSRHRLAAVDAKAGTLQFTGAARWNFFTLEPYHRLHFENYRGALDAPGEWFLARDGTLSYLPLPGERIESTEAIAPVANQWLVIRASKLRFVALRFAYQTWTLPEQGWSSGQADPELPAAIEIENARDIAFENCEFRHTLTHAIRLRAGVRGVRVTRCHLRELGAGGIYIGETAIPKAESAATGHATIDNCIIQTGGRHFPGSIGVWIGQSGDNAITHCDIGDWFYSAVSMGWIWGFRDGPCKNNRIENCHLHHLGWGVLSDLGAVYTLAPSTGSVIRGCRVHDIACSSYGGWGLYNDEGSTGVVWENNLVYRTQDGSYHQHYGKENVIRNNIFAFSKEMQLRHSRSEDHLACIFERNIVIFDTGKLLGHLDAGWQGAQVKLERNLYWRRDGQPFDFAGKSFADWQASGQDAGSIIADPLFVDPDRGDFHLREGSPAAQIGFVPFDYEKAGVTGDAAWKALAAQQFPDMTFGEKPKAPPLALHDGFENTPPGAKPARAHVSDGGKAGAIAVSDDRPSHGARCLKITDEPGITPPFNPHFYYVPSHRSGTTRVAFDLRLEPGIHFVHEWRRTDGAKYRTGPLLEAVNGKLRIAGRDLADIAPNEWTHLELRAAIGEKSTASWSLTVTVAGQPPRHFDGLKFIHDDMRVIDWIGFVSQGREAASYWLDEIEVANSP